MFLSVEEKYIKCHITDYMRQVIDYIESEDILDNSYFIKGQFKG